jgi:antitoxin (DNA-binding transcriptional repressor) of toxin-antitoxin stability system
MSFMKVVGINQLKARLSEYVRLAKAGETVLVTKSDEIVAELRPSRRQTPVADGLEELLEALAASGETTRAPQPKDCTWRSRGLGLPSGAAQALLDELRQETRPDQGPGAATDALWPEARRVAGARRPSSR